MLAIWNTEVKFQGNVLQAFIWEALLGLFAWWLWAEELFTSLQMMTDVCVEALDFSVAQ